MPLFAWFALCFKTVISSGIKIVIVIVNSVFFTAPTKARSREQAYSQALIQNKIDRQRVRSRESGRQTDLLGGPPSVPLSLRPWAYIIWYLNSRSCLQAETEYLSRQAGSKTDRPTPVFSLQTTS